MNPIKSYMNATDKRSCLMYIRQTYQANFAHWLIAIAKRIMPDGYCRGTFNPVNRVMEEELKARGEELTAARYNNKLLSETIDKLKEGV